MSTTPATETPDSPPPGESSFSSTRRRPGDSIFSYLSTGSGLLIFLTLAAVGVFLYLQSHQAIMESRELTGDPEAVSLIEFTAPLVYGTILVSAMALVMAVPVAIGIALFISHFAPRRLAAGLGYIVDLLAAVPSVVFGLWGGVWLVPRLEPLFFFLNDTLGQESVTLPGWLGGFTIDTTWPDFIPWLGGEPWIALFGGDPTAPMRNLASAAVVLAVMIVPIIAAVSREVFLQTPRLQEEAALSLGATRWETIKTVVLPFGRRGVLSASMLGLGRALGETMAVLMILAPGYTFSLNVLVVGQHNSIAANIASQQAEASGVDMSRLVFTGLVLFVLTFIINSLARSIVARGSKG